MLYFFGDSWSAEVGELESWYQKNNIIPSEPLASYPAMVSKLLNVPYKNFSIPGSSQPSMIPLLTESGAGAGDHAIFSLTSSARRFYYDDNNKMIHLSSDVNKKSINEYQDSWISASTCFTLYSYCIQHKIQPWFISTFETSCSDRIDKQYSLWNSIPDHVWILPKETCVVQTEFDPEWYAPESKNLVANLYNWLNSGRPAVEKYIRPCSDHPNLQGRKKIAQRIISVLKDKIKEV
jgi:hypothetical protein